MSIKAELAEIRRQHVVDQTYFHPKGDALEKTRANEHRARLFEIAEAQQAVVEAALDKNPTNISGDWQCKICEGGKLSVMEEHYVNIEYEHPHAPDCPVAALDALEGKQSEASTCQPSDTELAEADYILKQGKLALIVEGKVPIEIAERLFDGYKALRERPQEQINPDKALSSADGAGLANRLSRAVTPNNVTDQLTSDGEQAIKAVLEYLRQQPPDSDQQNALLPQGQNGMGRSGPPDSDESELLRDALIKIGESCLVEGNWRDLHPMVIRSIVKYATEALDAEKKKKSGLAYDKSSRTIVGTDILAERNQLQAENERLRGLLKDYRDNADDWSIEDDDAWGRRVAKALPDE